jgi:hypothetical protein
MYGLTMFVGNRGFVLCTDFYILHRCAMVTKRMYDHVGVQGLAAWGHLLSAL